MMGLNLSFLGGFEACLASGPPLTFGTKKSKALLAYLALRPGMACTRDNLAALLWGDTADQQARNSLRQNLSLLRKSLSASDVQSVVSAGDTVSLSADGLTVDVAEFERLAAQDTPEALEQAATLYRGDLLEGFALSEAAFEEWLAVERGRLREVAQAALAKLLEHYSTAGPNERAVRVAVRLLALDPLQEPVHRTLMRLYVRQGRRGTALRHYQVMCETLRRDLGIGPEPETERLYREISRQGQRQFRSTDGTDGTPPSAKPSIAVLPFTNLSGDPSQDYFSDGITEDIITALSRFRSLLVIARNSTFSYRGKDVNLHEVANELNVAYVVQGSVRRSGKRVRITAQLVDAATGYHLWGERYDRGLKDIFAVQDEVTQTITSTLAGRLEVVGREQAKRKRTENLEAYDYVLQGNAQFYRFTKKDNARARNRYRNAIEQDPECTRAHTGLAWSHLIDWMCRWAAAPDTPIELAFESARLALATDDTDSLTHSILGELYLYRRQYDEATNHLERALALNPNDADAIGTEGFLLTCLGHPDEGIEKFSDAKRLNPFTPDWCLYCWRSGIACYSARHYEPAITVFKCIERPVNEVYGWMAASYAQLDRLDEARAAMEKFLRLAETESARRPGRTKVDWETYWAGSCPYKNRADFDHLLDGLRNAGLPV